MQKPEGGDTRSSEFPTDTQTAGTHPIINGLGPLGQRRYFAELGVNTRLGRRCPAPNCVQRTTRIEGTLQGDKGTGKNPLYGDREITEIVRQMEAKID